MNTIRFSTVFIAFCCAFLCGCASHKEKQLSEGQGDCGAFILAKVIEFGGKPAGTNGLPVVGNTWRYLEDTHGVLIHLPREQYPAVETFLLKAFGKPDLAPADTADGGRLGAYRLKPKNVGIQFGYYPKYTQVVILKPETMK